MPTCPCCGALRADRPTCQRCQTDFTWLLRVEHAAERRLGRCYAAVAAGNFEAARHEARRAYALHRSPSTQRALRATCMPAMV